VNALAYAFRDAAMAGARPPGRPTTRPRPRRRRRAYRELTAVGQSIVRAHALKAAPNVFVCPVMDEVEIPEGRRPVYDRADALAVLQELAEHSHLRADSYATRMAVCAALAEFVHPETGMAIAGQDVIAARASEHAGYRIARTTAGDHLRAIETTGAVVVALRGSSREANGGTRNLASVYVVTASADTLPPAEQALLDDLVVQLAADTGSGVDELRHLPFRDSVDLDLEGRQARIAGNFSCSKASPMTEGTPSSLPRTPTRRENAEQYAARTDSERRVCVAWLIHRLGWSYQERTEHELLKITAPFFRYGWSAQAIHHAFLRRPDGTEHRGPLPGPQTRDRLHQPRIRNLGAVLTARMNVWRDQMRQPLQPPIQTKTPPRGRPPGAVTRRRVLIEQAERLPYADPRRVAALAELGGQPASRPVQERPAEVEVALASLRQRTGTRLRRTELITLLDTAGR
jgi:hypothetical protein